VSRLLMAHQHN